MKSYLIQDTTREEREKIVAESIGSVEVACDGCARGWPRCIRRISTGKRSCARSIENMSRATFQDVRGRQEASAACFERRD